MFLSTYVTDIGRVVNNIDTVIRFTEGSKLGTRSQLIAIVGLTYWSYIKLSKASCPHCFGQPRRILITTNDGYQVEAEVPFTFASTSWVNMLSELNSNPKIIGIETTGERINNHYLRLWL